jgi:hypothetical protein
MKSAAWSSFQSALPPEARAGGEPDYGPDYAPCYIIRFRGMLTQGPNAGKRYEFATSWGGVQFLTEAEARATLADDRQREPGLEFKLLRRQFRGRAFVETEVPI